MTINKYISDKFQKYGITMPEADLLDIALNSRLNVADEVTDENITRINVAIVRFVPELLLRATSISESGFSMSWNLEGLKSYYTLMCKHYGIKDKLSNEPKATFL